MMNGFKIGAHLSKLDSEIFHKWIIGRQSTRHQIQTARLLFLIIELKKKIILRQGKNDDNVTIHKQTSLILR